MTADTGKANSEELVSAQIRRRIFGGLVVLIGVWWITSMLSSQLPRLLDPERPGLWAALAGFFLLLILVPGALFAALGIRIFLQANESQVKIVVAVCLVFLMVILSSGVPTLIPAPVADDLALLVAALVGIALFGPLVGVVCAFLKLPLSQVFPSQGRGILLLPSFLLWIFLSDWFFEIEFLNPDSPPPMMNLLLQLFLPLVLTVVFYRLAILLVSRFGRTSPGPPPPSWNPGLRRNGSRGYEQGNSINED